MKPIIFSTEMVRAILEGRKTMTRRVVKPQPSGHHWEYFSSYRLKPYIFGCDLLTFSHTFNENGIEGREEELTIRMKYTVNDVLYVKETYNETWGDYVLYKAKGGSAIEAGYPKEPKWKPATYMPKSIARIFLRVKNVKVERLQDITEKDSLKEGCKKIKCPACSIEGGLYACIDCNATGYIEPALSEFINLWDSLNEKKGYGWKVNPWVYVVEFEKIEKDIENESKRID